ncbi:aspartate--ammonia ligase [bacterium]|nr:aspartate--ammonia ligase [bacterium]
MRSDCIIPKDYQSLLDAEETEEAIKLIKDFFQKNLAKSLNLIRVTAPLFVKKGTGINDDLSGREQPVSFTVKHMNDTQAEIVQSLAKWKRLALSDLKIPVGKGLYADMNAIRPDEKLDNLHSLYVDQWDWEKVISAEQRNLRFLKNVVRQIYTVMKKTEHFIYAHYPSIKPFLPDEIHFIHAEELLDQFPDLSPPERENVICKEKKAVFVIGIGAPLKNGEPHDQRAPDYDDWITPTQGGKGLNGDILIHYPVLDKAFEISSMGIRVDSPTLEKQLDITQSTEKKDLYFHKKLFEDKLPLSVGGGIGQSRLCMFFLRKAHIGEIQSSLWDEEVKRLCRENNIFLL